MRRAILILGVIVAARLPASPMPADALERKLQHELLAPCCYRETVDRHESQAAFDMKKQIHQMVEAGMSEGQILARYKAEYGERILAEPEGLTWWMETIVPLMMCAAGLGTVIMVIRRWSRAQLPAPAA